MAKRKKKPYVIKSVGTYWDHENREVREYELVKGSWPVRAHPKTGEMRQVVCRFTGIAGAIINGQRLPFEFPLPDATTVTEAFAEYARRVKQEGEWYRDYRMELARQQAQRAMLSQGQQRGRIITPGQH